MIFNLKYLILPLSIITCINNNCINAMDDTDENQNEIIEHNNGNNTPQIQNQSNNDLLNVNINNENDEEKIKQLVTEKITDMPAVKFLIKNTLLDRNQIFMMRDNNQLLDGKICFPSHYRYQILNLLESLNIFELNKPFTIDQLIMINDIVKTINFFVQKDKEYNRQTLYHYYKFDFAVSDNVFGIGLSNDDKCNRFSKCIFIRPSSDYLFAMKTASKRMIQYDKITDKSFRNFLDAVKLCSDRKLPITFEDKNGIQYNNPYLITKDGYKTLLTTLMKDFWISFWCGYECDILYGTNEERKIGIDVKSDKEYENLKNEYNKLKNKVDELDRKLHSKIKYDKIEYGKVKKESEIEYSKLYKIQHSLACYECKCIVNVFENNYDEENFIKIFGEETINNIRYIINHLIDFEINSNYKLFEDTLDKILSKEENLYETMRRPRNRGEKLIDKCVQELEKVFNLNQRVWTNNIVLPEDEYIFKQLEDESKEENQYKLHSEERVEDYLKKLLYDKVLDTYLRTKVFKYIMGSNYLRRNMKDDPVLNKKLTNHDISNIKSKYVFSDILKYITLSKQKDLFFGQKKKEEKDSNSQNNENIILNDNYNNNFEKFEESNNKNNDSSDDE